MKKIIYNEKFHNFFFSHMDGVRKKNLHAQLNVGRWPFMNTSYELHDKADIL